MSKPAILGGEPVFPTRMRIVSPVLPALEDIQVPLREALTTGQLTNHARNVPILEETLARYLGVPYVVTVGNATSGLILALSALRIEGEVILPSFTFSATAHSIFWNGLKPVFVDILPDTFTLDPTAVEAAITSRTAAILAVHIYGHPCEIDELEAIAERYHLPVLFDAAQAFGSCYRGRPIGQFGAAEVFSFHATKVFPVGEGGCITTRDSTLAEYLKLARNFGDPGSGNSLFPGLNAKMQEFNAILGLAVLESLDEHIANRRAYAACLRERLGQVPGITFQAIRPYVESNFQNFAILVDTQAFGLSRDLLFEALAAENIAARKYFYPPVHQHEAYQAHCTISLPITERVSRQVLCLPFYSVMSEAMLDGICTAVERIHRYAGSIRRLLSC